MAYTPTTWATGDTVTATKMNKLEQGVANAGGGGTVFFEITTINFPNSSNVVGAFVFIKKNGDSYTMPSRLSSFNETMTVYGNRTACEYITSPVPSLENYYLALSLTSGVTIASSGGGLADEPVIVNGTNMYIVTGDFTATFSGWV